MNAFWNLLPSGGWERLLADAAWQSSAIATCALIAAWLVRRRPALLAAILFSAAALSLAAPLLSSVVRLSGGGLLSPPIRGGSYSLIVPRELHRADGSAANVTIALPAQPDNSVFAETSPITAGWRFRPWPWIVGLWLAASGCLAFRLLRGVLAVRRWIKMGRPCHDAKIEAALSRAAQAIGVRPPELLWSAGFNSPALVVLGPARLLLPTEMPADVDWFAVFCHELAHRARRDDLSRLVVELAVIALPWQPLLWLVRRRFRAACEEACDDWAVDAGADPVEFASLLVALVPERRPAFALGMAESPAATRHRILRLLAMQGTVHPRLGTWVGAAGWVAAIALAITLALLQFNSRPRLSDPVQVDQLGRVGETRLAANNNRPAAPPWGNTPLAEAIAQAAAALPKAEGRPAPYIIERPDILLIDAVKLVPKSPYHIEPLDVLKIQVANPLIDQPVNGPYTVDPDGAVDLGPTYGKVSVAGQTLDEALKTIETHLKSVLRDPQVSVTLDQSEGHQQIAGEHLVGPDGTVNMGTYGTVYVAGMTIAEAKAAIEGQLSKYLQQPRVSVDVFAYNSMVYYVIHEGTNQGDTLIRAPITGNETVLDALAQRSDGRIPDPANCWVWVARPKARKESPDQILPVDWQAVLFGRDTSSNWQIQPGDRIFVRSKSASNGDHPSAERPSLGGSDSAQIRWKLASRELESLVAGRSELMHRLRDIAQQIRVLEEQKAREPDAETRKAAVNDLVEAELAKDPVVADFTKRLYELRLTIENAQVPPDDPNSTQTRFWKRQIANLEAGIERRKSELYRGATERVAKADPKGVATLQYLEFERASLQTSLTTVNEEIETKMKDLEKLGTDTTDEPTQWKPTQ